MKVTEGVYLVGGPEITAPEDCNVYLVENSSSLLLIDSGCGNTVSAILERVEQAGLDPQRLETLVLTHAHIDHCGGAAELVQQTGARVIAHRGDREAIEGREPRKVAAEFYGVEYTPVKVDRVMEEKEMDISCGKQELQLLHVPGHTPGSIVVWGDFPGGRVLFGQDLHGPLHPQWGSDRKQWTHSLQEMLSLKADILCEGHFGIYRPAPKVELFIREFLYR